MSMILAATRDRQMLAATEAELDQARQVVDALGSDVSASLAMSNSDDHDLVTIPRELSRVITQVLQAVVRGGSVTVTSMPEELTTSTAAEQLGVSRPTLMQMVKRNEIPSHKVGTHTRLRTSDVLEYRRQRAERRRQAFDELRSLEDAADKDH